MDKKGQTLNQKLSDFKVELRNKKFKQKIIDTRKKFLQALKNKEVSATVIENYIQNNSIQLQQCLYDNNLQKYKMILKSIKNYISNFSPQDTSTKIMFSDYLDSVLFESIQNYYFKIQDIDKEIECDIFTIFGNLTAGPQPVIIQILQNDILNIFEHKLQQVHDIFMMNKIVFALANLIQEREVSPIILAKDKLLNGLQNVYKKLQTEKQIEDNFIWFFEGLYKFQTKRCDILDNIFLSILTNLSNVQNIQQKNLQTLEELSRAIFRFIKNTKNKQLRVEYFLKTRFQQNFSLMLISDEHNKKTEIREQIFQIISQLCYFDSNIIEQFFNNQIKQHLINGLLEDNTQITKSCLYSIRNLFITWSNYFYLQDDEYIIQACCKMQYEGDKNKQRKIALELIKAYINTHSLNCIRIDNLVDKQNILQHLIQFLQFKGHQETIITLQCIELLLQIGEELKAQDVNIIKQQLENIEEHQILYKLACDKSQQIRDISQRILKNYIETETQSGMITENQQYFNSVFFHFLKFTKIQNLIQNKVCNGFNKQ